VHDKPEERWNTATDLSITDFSGADKLRRFTDVPARIFRQKQG